jgi:uncharacterized protein YndB with AHSA1/START domain
MGMAGTFREVVAPSRIVHTEIFDEDWTGGETTVTTTLTEDHGTTTLAVTVLYAESRPRRGARKPTLPPAWRRARRAGHAAAVARR